MSDEKQLPPCDAEVFEKGESIGLFPGIKKEDVERLCKGLSAVTGWRIDWSYFAGRPHIRALAPAEQHQGEPVELDALTDLATWKRRAIEAESKLRTYDPQVVELGEQAMQALLAEPKPSELVLTKCRLCDQLQADLTERDERIDQLRSGYVFETGPYQVELSEDQWRAALGVFENYNMGDDKHFVFLEEHGRGVISEILIEIGVARAPDADEVVE